ncbi:NAD(P)/FAD-dependent oxidoreductase [Fodinicurvata halophila]|uniref:NAD(P)/FAD-dependent oxidoreductase n=1 Tax=Fodinicurvata halophila TaxID=1419723 RepID=A0ABV8UGI8_9PROT
MKNTPLGNSLWHATAAPAPPTEPLEGDIQTEVCVVGGGYTGLSTAIHLARSGRDVVLLEAEEIGHGGSGRNAGHCTPTFIMLEPGDVKKKYGDPWGERILRLQADAAQLVFSLINRYDMDCEGQQNGYLQVAHTPAMEPTIRARCESYADLGKDVKLLGRDEVAAMTGSDKYFGGWLHPEGGHLNPLGYARGLARAAISEGARLHTRSRVTGIEGQTSGWRVKTAHGSVSADKVVIGTGAYTDDFWPRLKKSFVNLTVACFASEPLSGNVRQQVLPGNHHLVDTRKDPCLYKYNKEGRLVTSVFVESRRGRDGDYTKRLLSERMKWLHPQVGDLDWPYHWFGDLDMQPDTFPRLFELAPGVVASIGYSGRGVPTATAMGPVLADWACGVAAEDLSVPLQKPRTVPQGGWIVPRILLPLYRRHDRKLARRAGLEAPAF